MDNRNIELTVLKALGILVVVSCHLGSNLFNLIGIPINFTRELFPEYSYHMPLFIFTSGYFYKCTYENNLMELIQKRFVSIKKYFNCNLFYFFLSFLLVKLGLLSRNIEFNFNSLFIEPFLGGFQFYFNGPGWFVPFLFLLQIIYVCLRKSLSLFFISFSNKSSLCLNSEVIYFICLVILGVFSTSLSNKYPVINDNMNIFQSFLRILFGLQFFQLGFLYKEFIEEKINLSLLSFSLIIISKVIIYSIFGYYTFSLRTIKFNNHFILPFIVSILGILYLLHLTKFIIKLIIKLNSKVTSFICIIGNNTWSIMIHHLFIKWFLGEIYDLPFVPYSFLIIGNYLLSPILCVLLPILFTYLYDYILTKLRNKNELLANT